MMALASKSNFSTANPHALATILEASETKRIIASRDIFDISGIKLWARDLPVSHSLQRKLLDRQLRHPLEACLAAEDGVTTQTLAKLTQQLLAQDCALTTLIRPHADRLLREITQLPLHSVVQLLLTANQESRPESFEHAVQAMALNGAFTIQRGGRILDLRLAMLSGLMHDLGEMYIDPKYGESDADRRLDFESYQQLVVHPHVGRLLVEQLTDYPPSIARAIAEHHERLDGSGYPHRLVGEQVSPLGRQLAAMDAALGVLRGAGAQLARASVALRVVPGEYDLTWVSMIESAARAQPTPVATLPIEVIQTRLTRLDTALKVAQNSVDNLAAMTESPPLKEGLHLARHLLGRLQIGWDSSGLSSAESVTAQDAAEVEAVEDEILYRLRAIERAALLQAGDIPADEALLLSILCESLAEAVDVVSTSTSQ